MRLKIILSILLPAMEYAVTDLRNKDDNSTGKDDIVANQLEAVLKSLKEYVNS